MNTEHILEMNSQESQLREYWYTLVKEEKIEENRHQRNVMFRHAFLVAASEHSALGITAISKIIGRHHATLIHAQKNHESNLRFNRTYRSAYQRISINLSDILMSEIDFSDYSGYKDENRKLRLRLMKLAKRNRELIYQQAKNEEKIESANLESSLLRERLQDRDQRINALNKKLSSIAW